jgi:IS4 transposase
LARASALYARRWHIERDIRNIKTTLGMEVQRCMTPTMVEKELWVCLLAYNLIRCSWRGPPIRRHSADMGQLAGRRRAQRTL